MGTPLLLDLYCCSGGAAVGYARAGYRVVGVDSDPRMARFYPFEYHRADALEFAGEHGGSADLIHASPPCQRYSAPNRGNQRHRAVLHPDLIGPTRALLDRIGRPYVIENVPGAPLRRDVLLCGEMFGLGVIRHRVFELGGWRMNQPAHRRHRGRVRGWRHGKYHPGPYLAVYGDGGGKASPVEAAIALGIDWIHDRALLVEAIPPAYTEAIGRAHIEGIER